MAKDTEIAWCDDTHNSWWGCSKIAPGCDNCYAAALDKRTGGNNWDGKPKILSDSNWKNPLKWNANPVTPKHGLKPTVFCGSMCDWTDKNAPEGQRERLWDTIRSTPNLDWLLLTKRVPNIKKCLPGDWGDGYANVWLGVTVENKEHGLPRIDVLREVPAKVRFLSIEPLLEDLGDIDLTGIHWVIVGGESGAGWRPMDKAWAYNIKRQCETKGIPFFFKQTGGFYKGDKHLDGVYYHGYPR